MGVVDRGVAKAGVTDGGVGTALGCVDTGVTVDCGCETDALDADGVLDLAGVPAAELIRRGWMNATGAAGCGEAGEAADEGDVTLGVIDAEMGDVGATPAVDGDLATGGGGAAGLEVVRCTWGGFTGGMSTLGCSGFGTAGSGSGVLNLGGDPPVTLTSGDPSFVSAISTNASFCLEGVLAGGGVGALGAARG